MVLSVYLASSVFRPLQCLISALTQGGEGGLLFRLTCSVVLWKGGTLPKNITGVCGECSQGLSHTGFAWLMVCVLSQSMLFRLQVALQGAGPGLRALPSSKPLRFRFSGRP